MAARAIWVIGATASTIVASFGDIATALMDVLMVPRVFAGSGRGLMRAVRRGRSPGELHGQHQQHEDNEPTTHGRGF